MTELPGRELLSRVLRGEPVDRIPVSPFIHVNYVKEFFGSHDVDWAAKTPEVYRHFGFDLMHRNCTPVYDALGPEGPNWHVIVTREEEGRDETTVTRVETPGGELRSVEKVRWIYEYDAEASVVEYPIKSEADLDLMMRYQPPAAITDVSLVKRANAAVGNDGLTAPWIQGAFNLVSFYYRKLDDLLVDAVLNPSFYSAMFEYLMERYGRFLQDLIDAGVDMLSYAGNIANGKLVSARFFRQHIWPFEQKMIAFIQDQGVPVVYHNCGYARQLLSLYPGLGMVAYESLTPAPHGDTVLAEAVETFGMGTALLGNIDQIDLLRTGTPEEIAAAVQQTLDVVRGRSRFILATTDYFNDGTPHDNIHALADAGRRFGAL